MFILRGKGGISAKKLAQELGCKCSRFAWKVPWEEKLVINYGSKYRGDILNGNVITNKIKVSKILEENEIRTPKIYMKDEEIPDEAFPLLARRKYHSQGRDVIYIHNREQLENLDKNRYDYLIQYINKKSEYRVHVLGDYDTLVRVKIAEEYNSDPIVRSKKNGWKQISYDREFEEALIELARKTIKILNYDFGAVDIIRRKNRLYVLEVNSAPGLEPRNIKRYAEYFRNLERSSNG